MTDSEQTYIPKTREEAILSAPMTRTYFFILRSKTAYYSQLKGGTVGCVHPQRNIEITISPRNGENYETAESRMRYLYNIEGYEVYKVTCKESED